MVTFPANLGQALSGGNLVALPLALAGGVLAGMNPCCLALYPAAAGACCSTDESPTARHSFINAVAFVLGIALAIAALGTVAAYLGRIAEVGTPVKYAIAVIPIVMGIYRLGWVKLTTSPPKPLQFRPGFGGAFGTGLLLSLIIGPCGTPILASVLSYVSVAS
jgi:cytochrome c biogenesis protein CcdA